MKRIFLRLKQSLRNERGEITFFACFFVVGIVMLISFLLLYASIRITCINIRNGAKMELNNLSGTIYADTYRSQRETNFEEYLNTLYSSNDYTDMLEATAMLITIIAPPDIFDEIHIHLTAAVTTKRAIHIYTVCLSASDS